MERLVHRFLNRSAILTWCIRAAIVWVISLPLVWRAIQVLARFEGAAPAAFVAFFVILVLAKASLLVLLGRALDREKYKKRVLSGYKAASH